MRRKPGGVIGSTVNHLVEGLCEGRGGRATARPSH